MGDWSVVSEAPAASEWSVVPDHTDAGPEARRIFGHGGARSETKSDEELGLDEGPQYPRDMFGRPTVAKNNPGTQAYQVAHAGDEMNDPGVQLITAGAMAAPLAFVAGAVAPAALAPMVSGAVSGGSQAAMLGQNPLVGAALGAIPGIGTAARAADSAIGEAALNRATAPGFGSGPGPVAKLVGHSAGAVAGHAVGGLPGAALGTYLGGKAANLFSKVGDAATGALARRFEAQGATLAAPNMVQLPTAPLAPEPVDPYAAARKIGPNEFDAVDEVGPPASNHATVGDKTAPNAKPSLLDDVKRDAKGFRDQPSPDVEEEPPGIPLESQLERSVRMLSELKSAARGGNVSPTMIQDAVRAGMSPQAVAKTVGRDAFDRAMVRQ